MLNESNNNFLYNIKEWISENPIAFVGILLGIIIVVLLLTIGIVRTIIVFLLLFIGYWFGRNRDSEKVNKFLSRLFRRDE